MRNKDDYYLSMAYTISKNSDMHHKIGAVVVSNKKVISKGFNRWAGSNVSPANCIYDGCHIRWSIHAEVEALRRVHPSSIDGNLTLYVARRPSGHNSKKKHYNYGPYRMAKPCNDCMKVLTSRNVSRVVFTTDFGAEELRVA